jgi:Holliday junction resolvase RusA-like endonuclease
MIITVYGDPAPQGSKNFLGRSAITGKGIMAEQSKKVQPWRVDVKAAAENALRVAGMPPPLDCPIAARAVFSFRRPKSHYRTGKFAQLLREDAPAYPCTPPDLSKLIRSTEDALKGLVWVDDGRVSFYTRLAKVWVNEDPEALDRPGVLLAIFPAAALMPTIKEK